MYFFFSFVFFVCLFVCFLIVVGDGMQANNKTGIKFKHFTSTITRIFDKKK